MNLERLPTALLIVAFALTAALGLWYLAVRLRQPRLKIIAVFIGGFPVLGFGLQLAAFYFDWGGPPDTYVTTAVGPPSREASVAHDLPVPVTNHTLTHEVELTPRAGIGKMPRGSVQLSVVLRSPNGKTLLEKTETLAPAQGQFWFPLRAQFVPSEEGEHSMHLEIPAGVGEVKVKVRELR